MESEFKVGDYVICVDDCASAGLLTKGLVYCIAGKPGNFLSVPNNEGRLSRYNPERFIRYTPPSIPTDPPAPSHKSNGGSTDYYAILPGEKDLQDLIERKKMSFAAGNIFKAVFRLGEKDGTSLEYDLNKIIWFANRMKAELCKQ